MELGTSKDVYFDNYETKKTVFVSLCICVYMCVYIMYSVYTMYM